MAIKVYKISGFLLYHRKSQREKCQELMGLSSVSNAAERLLGSKTEKMPLDLMTRRSAVNLERASCCQVELFLICFVDCRASWSEGGYILILLLLNISRLNHLLLLTWDPIF